MRFRSDATNRTQPGVVRGRSKPWSRPGPEDTFSTPGLDKSGAADLIAPHIPPGREEEHGKWIGEQSERKREHG